MGRPSCSECSAAPSDVRRPKDGRLVCRDCFFALFEAEVHDVIVRDAMFRRGDTVALGASGGKDSTVLMHLVTLLNGRHDYGVRPVLVSVDEGIAGYRDDSLATVHRNSAVYGLPLHVVSYRDLYGWSMDEIVRSIGPRSNCTFCGVFRRQALDRGAAHFGADRIVTGHNADDTAETVLMNVLRSDVPRLLRCVSRTVDAEGSVPRVKPLKEAYEKEIVMYAHFKKLEYFTTECTYATEAFRGHARTLLKDLEAIRPSVIADTIFSGESLPTPAAAAVPAQQRASCTRCGYMTSRTLCRACVLLGGLNEGAPRQALRSDPGPGPGPSPGDGCNT